MSRQREETSRNKLHFRRIFKQYSFTVVERKSR